MSSESAPATTSSTTSSFNGRVKWFNNKAGYGFITTENDTYSGDVFVHHTALFTADEQYKYLVQGEYVEFQLARVTGGTHEWQAEKVSGLNGGKLMCETRRDARVTRVAHQGTEHQAGSSEQSQPRRPRRQLVARTESEDEVVTQRRAPDSTRVPRRIPVKVVGSTPDSNGEWMLVRRRPRVQQQGQETEERPRPHRRPRYQPRSEQ